MKCDLKFHIGPGHRMVPSLNQADSLVQGEIIAVSGNDRIRFSCHKDISCFGACCRDLNQFLTPYDILRIKHRLNLPSTQFLENYTTRHIGRRSGLPVITFRIEDRSELTCPFLSSSGCRIYEDRPTSCRLYPLARGVSKSRETGKETQYFALIREPFCEGFETEKEQAVEEWIEGQEAKKYIVSNDRLLELITLKNRLSLKALTLRQQHFFSMALYDLDRFRSEVRKGLLEGFPLSGEILEKAMTDDEALLEVGHQWVTSIFTEALKEGRNG